MEAADLAPGVTYRVTTKHVFEGEFVGLEEVGGRRVACFKTGGKSAKGRDVLRKVPLDRLISAGARV